MNKATILIQMTQIMILIMEANKRNKVQTYTHKFSLSHHRIHLMCYLQEWTKKRTKSSGSQNSPRNEEADEEQAQDQPQPHADPEGVVEPPHVADVKQQRLQQQTASEKCTSQPKFRPPNEERLPHPSLKDVVSTGVVWEPNNSPR